MQQLLGTLIKSIMSSIIAAITQRWDREQAEADRAAAKARQWQLEQARDHVRVQAAMAATVQKTTAPTSGGAWNAAPLLLACLSLVGCFRHYTPVVQPFPVAVLIERPVLKDESPFSEREQQLATYAARLEASLFAVRALALEQNLANGYAVGPADKAWLNAYRSLE